MGLTPEQIQMLLSKPEKAKRKSKSAIDTSDRSIMVWFKLAHKLFDEETHEASKCSNPNCPDTRERQMVAEVDGIKMCRRCFLDGYGTMTFGQDADDSD